MTRTPAQIGAANRRRGATAERAVVTWLRTHGWPGAERAIRTGYTTTARTSTDPGDITGTPGIVWQVTDRADIDQDAVLARRFDDTRLQQRAAGADYGVLIAKRRGHADPGRWWAWIRVGDIATLAYPDQCHMPTPLDAWCLPPVRLELRHFAALLASAGYGTTPA